MTTKEKMAIAAYKQLNEKGIPLEFYQDRALPETENELKDFATNIETSYRVNHPSAEDIAKVLEYILP